jgi:hypothetical protein
MTLRRVASPVDDEISSVLDLAQGASDFTAQLGGDFRWTVSQRGVAVEQASQLVGQGDAQTLGLASRVAHAVHQRHIGGMQMLGRSTDRVLDRRWFAIDQRIGVFVLGRMVQKPSLPQNTRTLCLVNAGLIGVQLNVVADTSAKGARCVVNDFQIHGMPAENAFSKEVEPSLEPILVN